jgi:hypothetical protein
VHRLSKLLRIWLVAPMLIVLAALSIPQIVLPGLVTLVGYLSFGVPVAHLIRTLIRRSSSTGAFSALVVALTAVFVGVATATGMATTVYYDRFGVEHPNIALWSIAEAGIAAALTATATIIADATVRLAAFRTRTRVR